MVAAEPAAPAPSVAMASDRAERPRHMISVRWIVTGAVVALTTAVVLAAAAISERHARQALTFEIESRLLLEARNLALGSAAPLLGDFPELMLQPVVKAMQTGQGELAFVVVLDGHGVVQGHSDVRQLGSGFQLPADLALVDDAPPVSAGESLQGNRRLLIASTPILSPQGQPIGRALVGLRLAYIERRVNQARQQQLFALAAFLVIGIAAAYFLSTFLMRPIAPLRAAIERIGRGDLDTVVEIRDRTELGALAHTLNHMARELKGAQLELLDRARMAHEFQLARKIQLSLLPAGPMKAGSFTIEGMQNAAAEVGGDYYQAFVLPGDRVGLVVADVSGKGLAGSLITAMMHALLRASVGSHDSPGALLAALDRDLGDMLERGSFVTMFYGILNPGSGELVFASAGHNPLLHFHGGEQRAEWVKAPGPPLGAIRGSRARHSYEDFRVPIAPGDVLVQCTDGITEAMRSDGGMEFGAERMAQIVADTKTRDCRTVLDEISNAVANWRGDRPQDDDETLLAVSAGPRVVGAAPARVAAANPANPDPAADAPTALALLARAAQSGERLEIPASLQAMAGVGEWFDRIAPRAGLAGRAAELARLALHEACANVAEHGYAGDSTQSFELWWVPNPGEPCAIFVLRDHGQPFRYEDHARLHFDDPAVRRRGRGLGLEIMNRATSRVLYCPETPEGNLMALRFTTPGEQEARV